MPHRIPLAGEARKRADKANGKGVSKLLYICETRILEDMSHGRYYTRTTLHGVDTDDLKTVTTKLTDLGYKVHRVERGTGLEISWREAKIK